MEGRIFFTSDLHFNHNKDFLYVPRGFDSIEEHDATIISNWNNIIGENDIVYVLGDVVMGSNIDDSIQKINKLNGTIIIILGNHDTGNKFDNYLKCHNVKIIQDTEHTPIPTYSQIVKVGKWSFYCSHYPTFMLGNLFSNDHLSKRLSLHGHTHSKDKFEYFEYGCYNVALDAHNNTPVLLEDIQEDIRNEFSKRRMEWKKERDNSKHQYDEI